MIAVHYLAIHLACFAFMLVLLAILIYSEIRYRRYWKRFTKRMLKLNNERRAILGLPPAKRWDE